MASVKAGTVEAPANIASLSNTEWTKPEYNLPQPALQFLFHLECDMESFRHIGQGPYGDRSTVIFKGGRFEGPKLRGEILPGGGDWEIVRDHGDTQTAHLNTRYNLVTHDGATIYLQTTGTRTGPNIKPTQFKMRLNLTMKTGDERYSWINDGVFLASSGRVGSQVIYDAYEVL
nr:hypothetical protein B0A51_03654 [Rachicladosporium sp. CCFEE 5018]